MSYILRSGCRIALAIQAKLKTWKPQNVVFVTINIKLLQDGNILSNSYDVVAAVVVAVVFVAVVVDVVVDVVVGFKVTEIFGIMNLTFSQHKLSLYVHVHVLNTRHPISFCGFEFKLLRPFTP